jgi:hypothetical protein
LRLLQSPRRRRRLAWGASIALFVAAGISAGVVFSNTGHSSATPFENRPAEVFKLKDIPFSGETARDAGRTISQFVQTAVLRKDLDAAWTLASPTLREGLTRAEWNRGKLPVVGYPAKAVENIGWRLDYAYRDDVVLDVMLTAKPGSGVGTGIFLIELKRPKDRWLVESWLPRKEFAAAEPAATPKGAERRSARQGPVARPDPNGEQISKGWFAIPLAFVALILLIPLGFFVSNVRARRHYRSLG